jgi:hypothetical protein
MKKVFLPRRNSEVVTDDDIPGFTSARMKLYLVYRGTCVQKGGHLLAIKEKGRKPTE